MNYYPENIYEDRGAKIRVNGPIAMAYVPIQKFNHLYSATEGYQVGTLFKELDLPFKGGKRQ